jgi:proteic killer suppression protein
MIQRFRHKGLQRLFVDGDRRGVRPDWIEKIENILAVLSRARVPEDMNLPGFRLHPLKGNWKGFWSVTVRANWRVIFRFEGGHVWDVDLIDYH